MKTFSFISIGMNLKIQFTNNLFGLFPLGKLFFFAKKEMLQVLFWQKFTQDRKYLSEAK